MLQSVAGGVNHDKLRLAVLYFSLVPNATVGMDDGQTVIFFASDFYNDQVPMIYGVGRTCDRPLDRDQRIGHPGNADMMNVPFK